jgi:hypothetical protein
MKLLGVGTPANVLRMSCLEWCEIYGCCVTFCASLDSCACAGGGCRFSLWLIAALLLFQPTDLQLTYHVC